MPDSDQNVIDPGATQERATLTLRIVSGPDVDKEFPLLGSEVVLGRSSRADIHISDNMLSRSHAKLTLSVDGWAVSDMGSTNGTWVRSARISEPINLPLRTPVRIGQTVFELCGGDGDTQELDERLISFRQKAMSVDDLQLGDTLVGDDSVYRENRQLAALYRLQSLLTGNLTETDLYHRILELITGAVFADNAYLLSWSEAEQLMVPVAERNQFGPVEVVSDDFLSSSIINYVKDKNEAILSVDAMNDERFNGESLTGISVRSVMCAPMLSSKSLCGLIYVISTKPERKYREYELKLLNAIAHAAGMAIENIRLLDNNIQSERMAAIGMTAASLSHYVKNILNGLEGSVSLLRLGIDSTDSEVMNQAWTILNKNHKRLSSLVLDLLNLAKEEKIEVALYNLAETVIETVDLVRSQCEAENITVEVDEELRHTPIQAEFDNRGIHRVVLNLLNNAIDAVVERYHGSGEAHILISAGHDVNKSAIEIVVSDNGAGVPADELEHIFESLYTLKGERGTGLGLAVSKRIVDQHKGKIHVESDPEHGSVFRVILPTSQDVDITQTIKVLDVKELNLGFGLDVAERHRRPKK